MKPYAERCADLTAKVRSRSPYKEWGPGAFLEPQLAEPKTAAERMAHAIVVGRYPRAITISVEDVIGILADALESRGVS